MIWAGLIRKYWSPVTWIDCNMGAPMGCCENRLETKTSLEDFELHAISTKCMSRLFQLVQIVQCGRTNYPGTKNWLDRRSNENDLVLTLSHLAISRCCFAEDSKEMYQNLKRKYRAIVFAH